MKLRGDRLIYDKRTPCRDSGMGISTVVQFIAVATVSR